MEGIYKVAVSRYGVNIVNRLLSLDISKDRHYILTICNLFSEYNDFDKVRNTISRYNQIEQYLDSSEAQNYDKYSSDVDIDIAIGTFRMSNNPNVLKNCQIYYDEGVCVYNPKSFQDASAIGGRIWDYCANQQLYQGVIDGGANIYFTYNALANHTIDYVAAIAKPNGYVDAYSKNGGRLNRQEYAKWKEGLGTAYSLLKPLKTNENKQYNNMNEKLIRLTESDIHRIVKESVVTILERYGKGGSYSFNGDGVKDCEFLTSPWDGYTVGLVNHNKKTVSPMHGYYYPNGSSKSLMKYALKRGYEYVDPYMPEKLNKTIKQPQVQP